jgi:alginate O-acetyltransferase complex protein AlgI
MQLVSLEFLLLFFAAAAIFHLLPQRGRWLWICVTSCLFYLSYAPAMLALLFAVILLNYLVGLALSGPGDQRQKKKGWYLFGLAANVGLLLFFKYGSFSAAAIASAARFLGLSGRREFAEIILPLGFSFFIFSALSYLIEIKRGRIQAERHLGYLAAYFLFFPKLAQGPIERPNGFLPQLRQARTFRAEDVADGLKLLLWGCFKKAVIADRLALYVNVVIGNESLHNGSSLLLAVVFYAFQIYADFSGYTDMALGMARVLGFRLTPNFRQPYRATSIREFWARWHITLSTWLRDYLFLPLSFALSRRLKKERYLGCAADHWIYAGAVAVTFSVAGAWHGNGLGYFVWGALFGLYLIVANGTSRRRKRLDRKFRHGRAPRATAWFRRTIVFGLVTFAWVFFRGGSLPRSLSILRKILFQPGPLFIDSRAYLFYSLFGILCLIGIDGRAEKAGPGTPLIGFRPVWARLLAYALLVVLILAIGVLDGGQFIYFQF